MIRKKLRKIRCLSIVLCLVLLVNTGCGTSSSGDTKNNAGKDADATTQTDTAGKSPAPDSDGEAGDSSEISDSGNAVVTASNAGPDGRVEKKSRKEKMRSITSEELVGEMTLGWNLGDSLDVCAADRDGDGQVNEVPADGIVDETLWGNVRTTKAVFETLKEQGINAVRIPVTWRDHMGEGPDYTIDGDWMDRVQEVVDYAYDMGMYVIINVHHDGGGDPDFGAWIRGAARDKDAVMERYKAVWEQIAERFENYSDYLIFESMNEVGFDSLPDDEAFKLLNEFNQEFVKLVRKSGGNNGKRHLLIAGYWTDIAKSCQSRFKMPKDKENRCILSVHYYTPWEFCTTNMQYTWGTDSDIGEMAGKIHLLKENFTDKGIPVIVGEFGTGLGNETESRILFCSEFVRRCRKLGIPAFFWDNGGEFDRTALKWRTDGLSEGMLEAAGV